jgi:hypothetical protein
MTFALFAANEHGPKIQLLHEKIGHRCNGKTQSYLEQKLLKTNIVQNKTSFEKLFNAKVV